MRTMRAHADDEHEDSAKATDATAKDDSIESVADEDDSEDIRPVRKPRPRRYKIQEVIKVAKFCWFKSSKKSAATKARRSQPICPGWALLRFDAKHARGGGISRKITNAPIARNSKKLRRDRSPKGAGLIVRTAGAKRTKDRNQARL